VLGVKLLRKLLKFIPIGGGARAVRDGTKDVALEEDSSMAFGKNGIVFPLVQFPFLASAALVANLCPISNKSVKQLIDPLQADSCTMSRRKAVCEALPSAPIINKKANIKGRSMAHAKCKIVPAPPDPPAPAPPSGGGVALATDPSKIGGVFS
jgi:hypothetical protein